jgi:hypothetical protein
LYCDFYRVSREPQRKHLADDHKKAAQPQAASLGEVLGGLGKQIPFDRNLRSGSLMLSYAFCEPNAESPVAGRVAVVK